MAEKFTISDVERRGDVAVVRVAGRLEIKSAQELLDKCREIRQAGARTLVLNLSDITFVASSGVGTLLALTEEFKEGGGGLRLVAMSQAVETVVNLLNLAQFLLIDATETDALEALGV